METSYRPSILGVIYRRVLPRRTAKQYQSPEFPQVAFDISEHTDGFYLYSQSVTEGEAQKLAALKAQTSNSTDEMSFTSARTKPDQEYPRPYTIGDVNWALSLPSPINRIIDDTSEDGLNSVLAVFSKVYSIAKIFLVILIDYGAELEDSCSSIALHVKHVEEIVASSSINVLTTGLEELYYALQSRLIMEMASVELCSLFTLDIHHLRTRDSFALPHPRQLYNIFLALKEVLDSPTVCGALDSHMLKEYETDFIDRSTEKVAQSVFTSNDFLGYRNFIMGIIADKSSSFNRKWMGLSHVYQMPPQDVLIAHSEIYLTVVPKGHLYDIPTSALPFVDPETVDAREWDSEVILAHRNATLAKLESKSIGEVRRESRRRTVMDFVREKRCVCFSACTCTSECTYLGERQCPCAERMLRLLLSQARRIPGDRPLGTRCSSLARAIFEGLSAVVDAHDPALATEVGTAIRAFENEIWIQREAAKRD